MPGENNNLSPRSGAYGDNPIARAIAEAIETVAAPEILVQIFHRALHMAREHEIPDSGSRLKVFIERHLRNSLVFHLGEDSAQAVMTNLQPILLRIQSYDSTDRRNLGGIQGAPWNSLPSPTKQRASLPPRERVATAEYPVISEHGMATPMVLVATSSVERAEALAEALKKIAAVQQADDIVTFLDNVHATSSLAPIVVIDCVERSVQPATIATMIQDLPKQSPIILWGADAVTENDLAQLTGRKSGWIRCDAESDAAAVGILVRQSLKRKAP